MANPVEVKKDIVGRKNPEKGHPGAFGVERLAETGPYSGKEGLSNSRLSRQETGEPSSSSKGAPTVVTPAPVVETRQPPKSLKPVTPAEVVGGILAESGFDQVPVSHEAVAKLDNITHRNK